MRRLEYNLFFLGCIFLALSEAQDTPELVLDGYPTQEAEFETGINSKKSINCKIVPSTVSEDPNFQWKYNGVVLPPYDSSVPYSRGVTETSDPSLMLAFNGVKEDMAGTYNCTAIINGQEKFILFHLKIEVKVELDERHAPANQELIKGQTGKIRCEPAGPNDMKITWYFNGQELQIHTLDRFSQPPDGLEIQDVQESDEGTYRCYVRAKKSFGDRNINVVVKWPPVITNAPLSQDAVAGTSVTMACQADGKPKATYEWFKDPQTNKLTGDRYEINEAEGVLKIINVIKEDQGKYKCKADNGVVPAAEATADINVLVIPVVRDMTPVNGDEEGQADLVCRATGDPVPVLTWEKVGGIGSFVEGAQDGDPDVAVSTSTERENNEDIAVATLRITNLESTDKGIYRCKAKNSAGEDQKNVELIVRYKPNFKNTETSVYTWAGQRGNVTCVVNGEPIPDIKWYRNKTEVDANFYSVQNKEIATDQVRSSLLTVEVNFGNIDRLIGAYRCEASNDLGTASQEITLKRAERPQMPVVSVTENTPTTITMVVSTDVGIVGGPKVEKVLVTYYKDSDNAKKDVESVSVGPNGAATVTIKGLKPSTPYTFQVKAESPAGASDAFQQPHTTLAPRKPYPITVTTRPVDGIFATKFNLRWNLPDDGGAPLTAINIRHRKINVRDEKTVDNLYQRKNKITGFTNVVPALAGTATSFQLTRLEPLTYYEVEVTATNAHGTSDAKRFIFKTAKVSTSGYIPGLATPLFSVKNNLFVAVAAFFSACVAALL